MSSIIVKDNFHPPFYLKHPLLQTFLNSSRAKKTGKKHLDEISKEITLNCGNNIKLQSFYAGCKTEKTKGIVILIHGWEGSSSSAYILKTAEYFLKAGYDIYRLNLRDHGESHHLNRGLFFGTLLDESLNGVKEIAKRNNIAPHFIMGFSMGANFALRMALALSNNPVKNINAVFAVNPPLNPKTATLNIDKITLIRKYFVKKWKKSLRKNQKLYPELYDFSDILKMDNCMKMTETLIQKYSDYKDATDYFSKYTINSHMLDKITLPTTILTSKDDPVIPVEDFYILNENKYLSINIQNNGGHCGYITNLKMDSWYPGYADKTFQKISRHLEF